MPGPLPRETAVIIPFPLARMAAPRLTAQDRAELAAWETHAQRHGFAQVTVCGDDLVTIYWRGSLWTIRVEITRGQRFSLSRHAGGAAAGFATVGGALTAIVTGFEPRPARPEAPAACASL